MKKIFFFPALVILSIAAFSQQTIPLYTDSIPNSTGYKTTEEPVEWNNQVVGVRNVSQPSLSVYLPASGISNGSAVIICPGGGYAIEVAIPEGRTIAETFTKHGVTAFVLKYRLAREEGSPYLLDKVRKEDGMRAIRMVRSLSREYKLDSNKIGMMGFSAGGEVVSAIVYAPGNGEVSAKDPVDRLNGRPDFQILVYPGPLGIPEKVPADSPPAFLVAANDDPCCAISTLNVLVRYREAKRPVEAHLYSKGDHAFNMGNRSPLKSIQGWPQRLSDWLGDNGYLGK